MQMLMTGDPISAQEAYRLGMVNELHASCRRHQRVQRGPRAHLPRPRPLNCSRGSHRPNTRR
jgi:enoyl-CoA hydratase/carnithine racemase